jgi:hypothetical protein
MFAVVAAGDCVASVAGPSTAETPRARENVGAKLITGDHLGTFVAMEPNSPSVTLRDSLVSVFC